MDNSDNAFRRVVSDNEEESSTTRVFGQTMVPSENSESVTETSENTKRKAIQSILRDKSLPELQRRKRIQALMDGSSSSSSSVNSSTAPHGSSSSVSSLSARNVASITKRGPGMATHESMACVHYERKCNIIAPCCGEFFGCRVCHDECTPTSHPPMDRFKIREVHCKICGTRQTKSNECINCHIQFGEYHCDICNLWMNNTKEPFHCEHCGICRVGGKNKFQHCFECDMCISKDVYNSHHCFREKYKNECPVCREDMFQSRQAAQDLPCGHAIHSHCFRRLASFDYRCPICKKTVLCQETMAEAWEERANDIERQPMPPDLARKVDIMCNDCGLKSTKLDFHFLGVRCPGCGSFNTVHENV
mmetsp:Transcript_21609/g.30268  ORF Transcript_21609/g.30268 Transcript_21609/m.30268 type:complete len:362 (+) Transcript_21609:251-1336(+)